MAAPLQFGSVEVRPAEREVLVDGQPVRLGGRAFDLLLTLIEQRDRVVGKAELFDRVWPGLVVEENNLQVQISALRRLLGPQAIATVAGRGYRFTLAEGTQGASARPAAAQTGLVTYLFTDIEGSTRLWEQHQQAMQALVASHDALCRALVERHGGQVVKQTGDGIHAAFHEPLAAVLMAVDLQRELAQLPGEAPRLKVRVGIHCGMDQARDGDYYGPAVNRAARVMSTAHGGQVLVSQVVADAIRSQLPDGIALRDLGSVRLRDLSGAERLFQVLHPDLPADFPPLRSLEGTPNNLPQQLNSFVGRAGELAELAELLGEHRLVTLLAMGGIGKSRLSVQLGAAVLPRFADGVWLVELAALTDPQAVPQAIASVLSVREEPGSGPLESLARFLRERRLLVILDNCEHLIDACAQTVKTLLQAAPGLSVLATSRDALNIAGEACYQLQPLAVPPRAMRDPEQLLGHEAVRLFVDRARAVRSDFRLDVGNAPAIAEICHRLDGIALAIELAAARVRLLAPDAIAARLDQRFKLLVSGDRTVLPRQKTLRALIEWSYDLLEPAEASMFERLSVFTAGWTLEAAEQVCGFGEIESADVLDLLAGLVQKSLVLLDPESARYRMLETVRDYGAERLRGSGAEEATVRAHAAFFATFAKQSRQGLSGPDQGAWMQRLDAEHENLLAALSHCESRADCAEPLVQLTFSLRRYWWLRGLLQLARRVSLEALKHPGLRSDDELLSMGLRGAGQICYFAGDHAEAIRCLEEALQIERRKQNEPRIATILVNLGLAWYAARELPKAHAQLDEAEAIQRRRGDLRDLPPTLAARGLMYRFERRFIDAEPLFIEALRLAREANDLEYQCAVSSNLAMLALEQGRVDQALEQLHGALALAKEANSTSSLQAVLEVGLGLAAELDEAWLCAHLSGTVAALVAETGLTRDPADEQFIKAREARARAAMGAEAFDATAAEGRKSTALAAVALLQSYLSNSEILALGITARS